MIQFPKSPISFFLFPPFFGEIFALGFITERSSKKLCKTTLNWNVLYVIRIAAKLKAYEGIAHLIQACY